MSEKSENFNNKTILITGGAGFIGSNLAFHFQNNYPESKIIVFDKFRNEEKFSNGNLKSFGHFENLIGFKGEVISGDITNKDDISKLYDYDIDIIFHEAAISDTTVLDQGQMINNNVNAFADILKLAKAKNAKVIYASSAATYGNSKSPQTIGFESPENVYGFSKLMMENVAKRFLNDIHIVGLRYFNVYGKNEFYKNKTASMVLQLGLQILNGQNPRLFYNSHKILRDFVYIEDVIRANILVLSKNKKVCPVYNVATGSPRSFKDIVDILQNELSTNLEIEYFKNPYAAYQNHTQADILPIKEDFAYEPQYTLELGIKDYIVGIKKIHEKIKNG